MEQQPYGGAEEARPDTKDTPGPPGTDAPDPRAPGDEARARVTVAGGTGGEARGADAGAGARAPGANRPGANGPGTDSAATDSAATDPAATDPAATDPAATDLAVTDVAAIDLETLRTVEHPVLAALVDDLRLRVAAPGSEALWGFDNSM
jgi:FXSXX-COOH protein